MKAVHWWCILAVLLLLTLWLGPNAIMRAVSYTPPGVQPPKGLGHTEADRIISTLRPCLGDAPVFVAVTSDMAYRPCRREE
jgi:hypothetical protein